VDLFDLIDLPSWLQVPESAPGVPGTLDTESLLRVRRAASGWLKSATGLADWPSPVPDDLWAWGIELAAIAFRNPTALASESVDDYTFQQDRARRGDILAAARRAYPPSTSGPQYSFPEPDWHWTAAGASTLTN
jgi:hypothetical protein